MRSGGSIQSVLFKVKLNRTYVSSLVLVHFYVIVFAQDQKIGKSQDLESYGQKIKRGCILSRHRSPPAFAHRSALS